VCLIFVLDVVMYLENGGEPIRLRLGRDLYAQLHSFIYLDPRSA
jgi:hypothetical protein